MSKPTNPSVCAVMCTYGRFDIVRQSITMFLAQDYEHKKLVIFNTAERPLVLSPGLSSRGDITVVNQNKKADGTDFTCLGDVRNASLDHAEGDLYICWDDDDLFMPWHISQCVKWYANTERDVLAWKPDVSYVSVNGGTSFKGVMGNSMEASFVVEMQNLKRIGFSTDRSGAEHVDGGWLSETKTADHDISPFESYGYVWGDERAPHKTSGHINDDNNFETHKDRSADFGDKPLEPKPLTIFDKFFEAALAVWDNPEQHELSNHSASPSDVNKLREMMRSFYNRFFLPIPEFLNKETVNTPQLESRNPYLRDDSVIPHGAVEGVMLDFNKEHPKHGFFVEFGAVDGISQSNTWHLENDLDWRGILIEPHTESFEYLKKNRPNVITVNEIVSPVDGAEVDWLEFNKFESSKGNFDQSRIYDSGLDGDLSKEQGLSIVKRKSRSLESILDECRAPRHINFLVIDVETSDLVNLVKSLPFDNYTFDYIAIEIPEKVISVEIFQTFTTNGFYLIDAHFNGPDYLFVRKSLL